MPQSRKKRKSQKKKIRRLKREIQKLEDRVIPELTQAAQQKALFGVIAKIRESLDLESIFRSTAQEVRQLLNADRVGMYRFDPESNHVSGRFVSEDVVTPYPSALASQIEDHCFGQKHAQYYKWGRIWVCDDIQEKGLPDCHLQILQQFSVRANLVIPLLSGNELWGLLCIHQCSGPRKWCSYEIEFVTQIAVHLGMALQQGEYVTQLKRQSENLSLAIMQAVGREKAVAAIIDRIRRSLDLDYIFRTTTQEVRQLLDCDRVVLYRFFPDWSGEFVVESKGEEWLSLLEEQEKHPEYKQNISECSLKNLALTTDTYLQETSGEIFTCGQVFRVCNDLYQAGFADCYVEALQAYQARAYAIIAIYKGQELWGLLAAFQNDGPREWDQNSVNFLVQIGAQLGVAIQQAELLGQAQQRSLSLQTTLETELRKRAEELSQEAERERALAEVIEKIRRTLDLETIFQTVTTEVRQLLNADRVAVFEFEQTSHCTQGHFVSEDVLAPYDSALHAQVNDHCFGEDYAVKYNIGHVSAISDIYQAHLSECHIDILQRFQVKANLVLPLLNEENLWGLLCIHQCSSPRVWQEKEIEFVQKIAVQLGVALKQAELLTQAQKRSQELQDALAQIQIYAEQQVQVAEQERALAGVIDRIRRTLDIDTIFGATTQEVRQILNCERVVVYQFLEDWSGKFVFESVVEGWTPLATDTIQTIWEDSYLQEHQGGRYRKHQNTVADDVYEYGFSDCHLEVLESFEIRAYMVVPVFVGDHLWGLLGAYQNSRPRHWEKREISLLEQVSNHLGVALQQAELLAQLQQARDRADSANHAKTEFLAHMSHELRTPLNAILGYTQLLLRDISLNPTQQEHLAIIGRSGEYLLTLLNDVLEMSKIEAGRIILEEKSFDLYHLLEGLEEMLQLKAESKHLALVFDCAPNVPRYVRTDESKLRQVLINLLGNAIKFTEEGSVVLRVQWYSSPDSTSSQGMLHCEVEDTGPGINVEELDSLFEAFVQTETGRKSQEGTGLGLPISQKFVRSMGGEITVESSVNEGSIFCFDLPIEGVEAATLAPPRITQRVIGLEPNQPTYRILVVDDKRDSRLILVNLLRPLGFAVEEARHGEEALALWQSWQPDLIWMDMRMPVMDGNEATRKIRASTQGQTPIIIALTATVFDQQRSVVLEAGCNDFVSKPLHEAVIFEKMAQHLGVRYRYQESPEDDRIRLFDRSANRSLKSVDLRVMSDSWIQQLHFAARGADEELLLKLFEDIPSTHHTLRQVLQDWMEQFQLDEIINLTKPFIE